MRKQLPCFLILLIPCICNAQFNDSIKHFVRLAASGNINRTTTATAYLFSNDARFSIRNKRTTLNTAANWVYGQQASTLTNNDFTATTDFNLYTTPKFYYWGLGNYTTSVSLRINCQMQAGLGVAYNFANSANAWLNVSNGLLYEANSLVRNGVDENYQTMRNSFRLSYRFLIKGNLTFSGNNFLQNSLREGNDYILRTSNTVGYKLNRLISLTASLTYNQVRRTGSENLLLTYGISLENYY